MRKSLKITIIFVLIWFIGKLVFFNLQLFQEPDTFPIQIFWNIGCLLLGMTVGIWMEKRQEEKAKALAEGSAMNDIKKNMASGMLYTVLVAGLLFLFYTKIDPSFNKGQILSAETRLEKSLDDPKILKQYQNSDEFKSMTKDEIFSKQKESIKSAYSPKTAFVMSLLGMMMLSALNAIILTFVFRRVLFRH